MAGTPDNQTPPSTTVDWEKRYKDLQAHATKTAQQNAALRAEVAATRSVLPEVIRPVLPEEDQDRLAGLLDTDPEAWRREMNALEQKAYQQAVQKVEDTTKKLTVEEELKLRDQQLSDFLADPSTTLTVEDLDKIPVGLVKRLESGEIAFGDYLVEADKYIKAGVGGVPSTPGEDIQHASGTTQGSATTDVDANTEYAQMIF